MKVRLSASGFELTSELEKYASAKIAHLSRQVPRKLRTEAACEVLFAQTHKKDVRFNSCSISFTVGEAELKAEETTLHMYSSLDIASVHIEHQLKDYVAKQRKHWLRTRLKRHFRRD
jgi:ribosomal subunit interface protein